VVIYSFKNFSYAYYGVTKVFENLNLRIGSNNPQIVAFVGPSGSGKTTLLSVMAKLVEDYSGEVLFEEKNLKDWKELEFRKKVLMLLQSPEKQLFEENILADVLYTLKYDNLTVEEKMLKAQRVLELVGLPKDRWDKPYYRLSGGEARKAALAAVLVKDSEVLLLDEPTSGIDSETRQELYRIFKNLKRAGKSIFFSSHDVYFVKAVSDEVFFVDNGLVKPAENVEKARYWGVV